MIFPFSVFSFLASPEGCINQWNDDANLNYVGNNFLQTMTNARVGFHYDRLGIHIILEHPVICMYIAILLMNIRYIHCLPSERRQEKKSPRLYKKDTQIK